jgi:hypothetical protein
VKFSEIRKGYHYRVASDYRVITGGDPFGKKFRMINIRGELIKITEIDKFRAYVGFKWRVNRWDSKIMWIHPDMLVPATVHVDKPDKSEEE